MTSAIAKELPPYRLDTVNSRHAGGERFRVHVLGQFQFLPSRINLPTRSLLRHDAETQNFVNRRAISVHRFSSTIGDTTSD